MIIFLYGPDTFRSRQKLSQIKDKFIREIDKSGLNVQTLSGAKLDPAEFENAVFAPAFLAKKRLVIIEDLISKNKSPKIQKEILDILNNKIITDTILVFWESEIGPAKAKKTKSTTSREQNLLAKLKKEKYAQEFELLNTSDVVRFAADEIKRRGAQIEPGALRLLVDLTGNDLWQLNGEVDKLINYAKARVITTNDVELLVKTRLDDDIFKLTDALGQRRKSLALKLIADQLQSGTAPTELLAKITWQFKNLLLVKDFMERHGASYPPARLSYQIGLHPFVIKKTAEACRHYQLENLKKIYRHLLVIDYQLKTSQTSAELLFDLLVIKN
ncbi:MAG: DNA polymerase III subunit delta [Candidatus Buchananbacteria bacterium]|nr:DNA polymerase III subunit delta [Candidatus Buchananbacteria bacterium]